MPDKLNRIGFTQERIKELPTPPSGRKVYYDKKTQGLCIFVTASGSKTFYVYRKVHGRAEQIRLGQWSESFNVAQARKRAGEINNQIDKGLNPNDIRRQKRQELTLGELFDIYCEQHANLHHKRPKDARSRFENNLAKWRTRKLSSIQRIDVQSHLNHLAKTKSEITANEAIKLLRAIYNKASDWGFFKGENPTHKVKFFRQQSRDRYLMPEELKRFVEATQLEPNETNRDFILMALFTGARRANLQEMAWKDVSLEQGVWLIPETKNGSPHMIHLCDTTKAILSRRLENKVSEWVFPGTGKTGHIVEPKKAFKRILDNAEIEDFRFHDIRRTHGSYLAMSGSNSFTIQQALGHKDIKSTAIYARLHDNSVRESTNNAAIKMQEIISND